MTAKYKDGQKVDLIILRETDLGFVAKINGIDEGLIYHNEVFEHLERGQALPGFIKKVREDGNIDLFLQPLGYSGTQDLSERMLDVLEENNGFLAVNDKTPAEKIYNLFGVSKKKYKMALGNLYKKRLVTITEQGISLNSKKTKS